MMDVFCSVWRCGTVILVVLCRGWRVSPRRRCWGVARRAGGRRGVGVEEVKKVNKRVEDMVEERLERMSCRI